jgi:hypothetical protein
VGEGSDSGGNGKDGGSISNDIDTLAADGVEVKEAGQ